MWLPKTGSAHDDGDRTRVHTDYSLLMVPMLKWLLRDMLPNALSAVPVTTTEANRSTKGVSVWLTSHCFARRLSSAMAATPERPEFKS
jgi:hypothetical protein